MWCSCFLLLLFFHHHAPTTITAAILPKFHDATTDRDALLSFRSLISDDPSKALASWNNKSLDFCQWRGVTCAGRKHPQRVIALKLDSFGLAGSMSPSLANLTFLRSISLSNNGFHGRIPQELGFLHSLRHLDFTMNSLGGGIPATLGLCFNLRNLSLGSNKLQGPIPNELGSLTKLVQLTLENNSLVGSIPPSITNLSSLAYLSLSQNYLSGGIPPTIGMLTSLTFLNLSHNTLSGSIPPSITNLSSLGPLFLSFNALSGGIPPNIDDLSLLIQLDLSRNELSGVIPPSLGNISSLIGLDLSDNTFSGGIPPSLGLLTNLTYLSLQSDNLSGVVPPSIWNLSALVTFDLASNQLHGTIPENIGHSLPNLEFFYLYLNQFHGPIPLSLSNASGLINVELNGNRFRGKIPSNIGNLKYLSYLILRENELEATTVEDWSFLAALTNCTSLEALQLDFNMLGGILPSYMANLSTTLRLLTMEGNEISGRLPTKIENLMSLGTFVMAENYLIGTIPSSIGMLPGLYKLDLGLNSLSGEIPSMLGNCTTLNQIFLDSNDLNGSIPATLANCQHLEALNLQNNKLTGTIPKEVLAISSFSMFLALSHNSLTGTIPSEVGSLINLQLFDVSENMLSGNIPDSLGKCQLLEYVYLQGNFFNGTIPSSLSTLEGILKLDLSKNNLTGPIPKFLGELRGLYYLNLSFNKLEGEVPEVGVFANASAVSVLGNNLCGGNQELHLPPCSFPSPSSKHNSHTLQIVIPISSTALVLILIFGLFVIHCRVQGSRRRDNAATGMRDRHMKISYHELAKATDGFSPANLIGTGSFGSAYRGILQDDSHKIVAVKVLNLQQRGASKSFISECEVLRNVRHRNLIKIVTSCSSVDFQGNDFKALVYEYMPNGSLDDWLHPMENALENDSKNLNLMQRLSIAIDVASALEYLHQHGEMPIVHCDLKPSNVLLDDDMTALVGDFGLARFLMEFTTESSVKSTSTLGLRGSIGYIAPEYGVANRVSIHGDVYSYGILLLELFTGKRPTDDKFKEGLSISKYVEMAFPGRVKDIIDARLVLRPEDAEANSDIQDLDDAGEGSMECIASILRIGLSCSKNLPMERMQMGDVSRELQAIREAFLRKGTFEMKEKKKLSKS